MFVGSQYHKTISFNFEKSITVSCGKLDGLKLNENFRVQCDIS